MVSKSRDGPYATGVPIVIAFFGLMAGKEERDLSFAFHGEHARGEGAAASLVFIDGCEQLHRRVVQMDELTLRGLPDQFLIYWMGGLGVLLNDVPLGGCGKGDTECILQRLQPVKGKTHPVLEQGDHDACGGIVLFFPCGIR